MFSKLIFNVSSSQRDYEFGLINVAYPYKNDS